jgi:hypothetical protein
MFAFLRSRFTTLSIVLLLAAAAAASQPAPPAPQGGALAGQRPRVLVSTDIGGTDPDDMQSMVHLLVYADMFDLEGIVSSPPGLGRREHILQVIDTYSRDYSNLRTYSSRYPSPEQLRSISKQGAIDAAGAAGFATATEGSKWIVQCARRADPRPLYVLVWGGIEDLSQALHDAPDIIGKLRVYFIGGPNKMWSANAYDYIEVNHPKLWMIEANSTYRGWFVGGNQAGEFGNTGFVAAHIAGHGALGEFFAGLLKGTMKMGDTPSVGYLLRGTPEDPSKPGWGGRFARIWDQRKTVFTRHSTEADQVEAFGIVEFALPLPPGMSRDHKTQVLVDNRIPVETANDGRTLRFRFSPRDAKVWPYRISSDFAGLNGQEGKFTAALPPLERTRHISTLHPNWWIDDPDPAGAEGIHAGAKSVNSFREQFLNDFAARMLRCKGAAQKEGK